MLSLERARLIPGIAFGGILLASCADSDDNPPSTEIINAPTAIIQPTPTFPAPEVTVTIPTVTTQPLPFFTPTSSIPETATPTERQVNEQAFYKGVDLMNQTKDRSEIPRTHEEKELLIQYAKELGVTHIAIATPYDTFIDGQEIVSYESALAETREWVTMVHEAGLAVSHRHMFVNFEGIYDENKIPYEKSNSPGNLQTLNYVEMMRQWMVDNAELIQPGDTWTPMPEPQNGGIEGLGCEHCVFESKEEFNEFIRNAVQVSKDTLEELDKENVEVICCGFDGFIVAGLANSDHEGKNSLLEKQTVEELGHIAIDHYPQPLDGNGERSTYRRDLEIVSNMWPDVPIYLTEMGAINGTDNESLSETFFTIKDYADNGTLKGVWYWQLGPSGPESLLNGPQDFREPLTTVNTIPNDQYVQVKDGFRNLP